MSGWENYGFNALGPVPLFASPRIQLVGIAKAINERLTLFYPDRTPIAAELEPLTTRYQAINNVVCAAYDAFTTGNWVDGRPFQLPGAGKALQSPSFSSAIPTGDYARPFGNKWGPFNALWEFVRYYYEQCQIHSGTTKFITGNYVSNGETFDTESFSLPGACARLKQLIAAAVDPTSDSGSGSAYIKTAARSDGSVRVLLSVRVLRSITVSPEMPRNVRMYAVPCFKFRRDGTPNDLSAYTGVDALAAPGETIDVSAVFKAGMQSAVNRLAAQGSYQVGDEMSFYDPTFWEGIINGQEVSSSGYTIGASFACPGGFEFY